MIYQSRIFETLKEGLDEEVVKKYLADNAESLVREMAEYALLFDPRQYERNRWPGALQISVEDAQRRIAMYQSHFKGWSMYEVDGVYLNESDDKKHLPISERIDDERTQILRLIFRLESTYEAVAKVKGCYDVLEAMTRWVMAEHGRLDHVFPWRRGEKERFFRIHGSWPRHKRTFVDNHHYVVATKEVKKWIDDAGMFVFGFLIRNFWKHVIQSKSREVEIWTVNFFNMNLNIVKETDKTSERRTLWKFHGTSCAV